MLSCPELLKKQKALQEKFRKQEEEQNAKQASDLARRQKEWLAKGEKYHKEYLAMQKDEVAAIRKAKAEGAFYVPAEKKVALVVRIRGINKHSPRVIRVLRLLRLRQINNATCVRLNKASVNLLRKVEPFIMYGTPSLATIRKLVYKRGFVKINKQRIPITSNDVVAKIPGGHVDCVEDIIHEIYTCGEKFKEVNNFLWPFKLRNPRGGFKAKRHPFIRGGDWGNREAFINEIVERML